MGFISRFTIYFKALIDQAHYDIINPDLDLDYWYHQQLEELQSLKRTIADVITTEKRLEMQQSQIQTKMAKLEELAQQALSANREDLARLSIKQQQSLQPQLIAIQQEIAKFEEQEEKFIQLERRHSAYTEAFRNRIQIIKAQRNMAQAEVKIGKIAASISEKQNDFNKEAVQAHKILIFMKACTNAMNQMIEQGTLSEVGEIPNTDSFLDFSLNQTPSQANIDAKLTEIKKAMQYEPRTQSRSEEELFNEQ